MRRKNDHTSHVNDQFESLAGTALADNGETRPVDVVIESNTAVRVDNTLVSPQELPSILRDYDGADVVFVYRRQYRPEIAHETEMDVVRTLLDTRTRFAELQRADYAIVLSDSSGRRVPAHVNVRVYNFDKDGRPRRECKLRIGWADGNVESVEFSVYHAFASAREQLEPLGLMPQCYGACPEVQVSGMQVDMGDGTVAYRMIDPNVRWGPAVNIFDTAPDISPAPVAEQRTFHERRRST